MRREDHRGFDATEWSVDTAAEALRTHGCRVTKPRVAVLRALLEHGAPLPAAELTNLAQRHEPSIHEATVYRTVNVLAEVGITTHVHAGHGPSLVGLRGMGDVVAVCRDCGAIEAVPPRAVDDLVALMRRSTGFAVELGHFALEGICPVCWEEST